MTDRVDQYLQGLAKRSALLRSEQAAADVIQQLIEEAQTFVTDRPTPNLTADIMRRINHIGHPPRRSGMLGVWIDRVWRKQYVAFWFRPAYGFLAATVLLAVVVTPSPSWPPSTGNSVEAQVAPAPQVFVQFRLEVPGASTVQLAGSFTGWQPRYELQQTASGLWTATLPLSPGIHDYAFIVDGERWVADPYAASVADGFGGFSSRLSLLAPENSQS